VLVRVDLQMALATQLATNPLLLVLAQFPFLPAYLHVVRNETYGSHKQQQAHGGFLHNPAGLSSLNHHLHNWLVKQLDGSWRLPTFIAEHSHGSSSHGEPASDSLAPVGGLPEGCCRMQETLQHGHKSKFAWWT
jgi:hypothetical protein